MVGIVIVTHSRLGSVLKDVAEVIVGKPLEYVEPVSIDITEHPDKLRDKIAEGVRKVNRNEGVLILTDMFGGTPSNISYSFLEEGRVEVISGVNLPVLIKAAGARKNTALPALAECVENYGRKSITAAGGLLKGNKRS